MPRQQFVKRAAETINVCATIDVFTEVDLLWRDVIECSNRLSRRSQLVSAITGL